jgi:hypothetical protein
MYHPALGIHEPKKMGILRRGFIRLGKYLRGDLHIPVDQYPNPDYSEITSDAELGEYLSQMEESDIALDTEVTRDHEPFCVTLSVRPGTGRLIRASDHSACANLAGKLSRWSGYILLHNRLFDRSVLARMGIPIPHNRIIDTMMEAYHLGNLPQGLKALAYRHLGMEMDSFDDLVTPHSRALVLTYYAKALSETWPRPEEELVRDKEGQWKLYRPQSLNTMLKRLFTDLGKNPELDVFDRWKSDRWESSHEMVEAKLGRWPGKDIRHAPFETAVVPYACRDADATLRLWPILRKASRLVRRKQEWEWYG